MPHPGQDGIRRGNLFIYLDTDHPNGLSRGQIRELRELIQLGVSLGPLPTGRRRPHLRRFCYREGPPVRKGVPRWPPRSRGG